MNVLLWIILPLVNVQEIHSVVTGTVTQSDGRPAAGVQVILQLEKCDCATCGNISDCDCCPGLLLTVTDGSGRYVLVTSPGTYSLRAKADKGEAAKFWGLELRSGLQLHKDIVLSP